MLIKVIALVGAAISGMIGLVGWSLARVARASDERIQRMLEQHLRSEDTQHDL